MPGAILVEPIGLRLFRRAGRPFFNLVAISLAYFVAAKIAFLIGTASDRIFAPFWPPNIVLFYALLRTPPQRWWQTIAAVLPAHVIAEWGVGMAAVPLAIAFATNCLVAVLNALAVSRLLGGPPWFGTVRNAVAYIVTTAGINPAIVAFGGAFVPVAGGAAWGDYWFFWSSWYLGNAINALTLGPILLSWSHTRDGTSVKFRPWRALEAALFVVTLAVACVLSFHLSTRVSGSPFVAAILCLPLPIIVWGSLRFGEKGGSGGILVLTMVSIWDALNRSSPFLIGSPELSVLALQLFLIGIAIPTLLLSAAADQLRHAERIARSLVGALLRAQDEERRRIARDIHDTTAQNLIAAGLLADTITEATEPAASRLRRIKDLIKQSVTELRTVAYVLHPPHLDQGGLGLALPAYVEGFSERSRVAVSLKMAPDFPRLPVDTEVVLYRVVQEALANIARHSGSETADVRLFARRTGPQSKVVLIVSDFGAGIPAGADGRGLRLRHGSAGVGLDSMRERVQQIGGRLHVKSMPGLTAITAVIPLDT